MMFGKKKKPMMDLMLDPSEWYYAHRNEVNFLRNPVNAAPPILNIYIILDLKE